MQDSAYALEVATGNWKPNDTLPKLITQRSYHGSCVVGETLYVVAGESGVQNELSTIEMLGMRLNNDLSFKYLSKSWREIKTLNLRPRILPFVSAIGKNSLLVYGGRYKLDGVIFDMDQNFMERKIKETEDLEIESEMSHGILTSTGVAIGTAIDGNNNFVLLAYRPERN